MHGHIGANSRNSLERAKSKGCESCSITGNLHLGQSSQNAAVRQWTELQPRFGNPDSFWNSTEHDILLDPDAVHFGAAGTQDPNGQAIWVAVIAAPCMQLTAAK